jgi:hypothetical protein
MTGYKAGDEVRVFPLFGPDKVPLAGWRAEVVAARDKELDARVTDPGAQHVDILTFALADSRSTELGGKFIFRPVDVAERKARRDAALAVLRGACITVEPGSCLDVEQVEALAEVVENWED